MSFFDPHHVSEYTGYYTKKGQVIQKRHVDRDYPLSERDKDKAIKVINAFGFKAVPYSYMPLEKYTSYRIDSLSYSNLGSLGPGDSFQVKLKNLLSYLPNLPIFSQVSFMNVQEFNIRCNLTFFYLLSNSDAVTSYVDFIIGEGVKQGTISSVQSFGNAGDFRMLIYPDTSDGYVRYSSIYGNNASQNVIQPMNNFVRDELTDNYIEGDQNLFRSIIQNDFSDPRFDPNIIEIKNQQASSTDIFNLTKVDLFFSVYVEVIYKTYID